MNQVVISGKIVGEINSELKNEMKVCRFKLKNMYYIDKNSKQEITIIRCIAYGALAEYCYNELYEGANILITGRVLHRHYISNNQPIDLMYVGCNTVTKLEQEEYS